jgi:hypothetical protein
MISQTLPHCKIEARPLFTILRSRVIACEKTGHAADALYLPLEGPWRGEVDQPKQSEGWSGGGDSLTGTLDARGFHPTPRASRATLPLQPSRGG